MTEDTRESGVVASEIDRIVFRLIEALPQWEINYFLDPEFEVEGHEGDASWWIAEPYWKPCTSGPCTFPQEVLDVVDWLKELVAKLPPPSTC